MRHPAVTALLGWFDTPHLPPHLQAVSGVCRDAATTIVNAIPEDSPELTVGLRKLLEAKDCFVRAAVDHQRSAS